MKIHILGWKEGCYSRHLYPLRVFAKNLRENDLEVKYFYTPNARNIESCDVLVMMEAGYRNILPIRNKDRISAVNYISEFFARFPKVIWFDDHDSSGMLRSYVFPFVTFYAKSQLLKNRSYYHEEHITGIPHLDFVNEQFNIPETRKFKGDISNQDEVKLRLSWNLAMINWSYKNSSNRLIQELILKNKSQYKISYNTQRLTFREKPISYRVGMWKNMPTVHWWRSQTASKLNDTLLRRKFDPNIFFGRVDKNHYLSEMQRSIVCPSPFGLGEICYRDFECFFSGALLLKPSMDHLQTWPDLYIDGVTYIPHKWDFSDFNEKLDSILTHPERYEEIAYEGQRRFINAITDGQAFASHFAEMVSGS